MASKIALFADERLVASSDGDVLILTTQRLRCTQDTWGHRQVTSMTLDALASCRLYRRQFPWLIVFGVLLLIGGVILMLLGGRSDEILLLFVAAGILFVLFFWLRSTVLSLTSIGGEAMLVPVDSGQFDQFVELIDLIEQTKLEHCRSVALQRDRT